MRFALSWTRGAYLAAVAVGAMLVAVVHVSAERYFLDMAAHQGRAAIRLHLEVVRGWLGRYRALAPIYSRDPAVVGLLTHPDDGLLLDDVNEKLSVWTTMSGASDTYVLDATGTAIAASNWADDVSFVGNDYSYRPYYSEAMHGRLGRFFALGTASQKRGYYFAHPVRNRTKIIGATVVKIGVDEIEQELRLGAREVFISDRSGVIVLAGHPDWRLKTIGQLTADARTLIGAVRQYDLDALSPVAIEGLSRSPEDTARELVFARPDRSGAGPREFLHLSSEMVAEGWTMHLLVDTASARAQSLAATLLAASALAVILLAAAVLLQRRARLMDRLAERERAGALLEQMVSERTAEVQDTNQRLEGEVTERIAAEDELRRTQADLVQAGKLAALGQMSTALSHEFNQPLTAVRTYAENALAFLERGSQDQAAANIERITTLTQRMAQLSRHLSSFARKPGVGTGPVRLSAVFDETQGLLQGRLQRAAIDLEISGLDPDLTVVGGAVRLQHVFMNLIGNAIDALEGHPAPRVRIDVETGDGVVTVAVEDNGPGIDAGNLAKIFDPFFTTKEVGKGLGLGLSISYNIIRDFGGTLRAENRAGGGARFVVTLRCAEAGRAAAGSVETAE